MRRALFSFVGVAVLASVGGGCAKPPVLVEPVVPRVVLHPPVPPPRVVEAYAQPVPEAPDEVPATEAESAVASTRPPARPAAAPPAPAEAPAPARAAAEPGLVLRSGGNDQKAVEAIRNLIAQAARQLGRVNYQTLDGDARVQHDIARRFMQQSEAALAAGNLMFAGKLADKAASMAAILVR